VREFEPVVDGLVFTECPRWHDGHVWYSDTHVGEVHRFDPMAGVDEIVARHSSSVAGLGFLPDGRLLAVSSMARKLLRLDADGFVEHADMSAVVAHREQHRSDFARQGVNLSYTAYFLAACALASAAITKFATQPARQGLRS